jgi:glycosyltransferase involved in cell wall biosynthesis
MGGSSVGTPDIVNNGLARSTQEGKEGRHIRIAVVHSFYGSGQPSGENRAVESEVRALRRAGHEVALVAARTDDLERAPLYPVASAARVASGRGRSPMRAIEAFGPEVVQVHNLFPNFGTRWVDDVRVPLVATLHNFRPVCANGLLFRDGRTCTLCPDGDPWAGLRFACYRGSRAATLPLTLANRAGPARNPLLRRADRVVVLSNLAREIYTRAGLPASKLVVRANFLEDDLDPGPGEGAGEGGWLYVGRLSSEKGGLPLVEAWPPGHALTIVGDGPDRAAMADLARGKRVELLGNRPREEVIERMRAAVGLVFPSQCFESFPLVYAESMACGLPVLAWAPNIVAGLVREDATGRATDWAEDLAATLGAAEETFPALRRHCREVFEAQLSERSFVAGAEDLYGSLTRGAR